MIFPLPMPSLTHDVDQEVHRRLRQKAPRKYWTFIGCNAATKFCFYTAFATLFLYVIAMGFLGRHPHAQSGDAEQLVQFVGTAMMILMVPGMIAL